MSNRVTVFASIVAFAAVSAFAANLGKYKNWPNSPQGYFMTAADHREWSKLQSEADAEQFIRKFVQSRGGAQFEADVAAAAKAADDHLSVGKSKGSETLRGKVVILLGPPSTFTIAQKQSKEHRATVGGAINATHDGGRGGGGGSVGLTPADIADANIQNEMTTKYVNLYTFTYTKDKLTGISGKDQTISIEIDPATGADRIPDTVMARQVNELLEAAAMARAQKVQ